MDLLMDFLVDILTDILVDFLMALLMDFLVDFLIDFLIEFLMDFFRDCLTIDGFPHGFIDVRPYGLHYGLPYLFPCGPLDGISDRFVN